MRTKEPNELIYSIDVDTRRLSLTLLLNNKRAAKALGISQRKFDDLAARGEFPTVRIDGCVRFDPKDLIAYIERKKRETQDRV